MKTFITSVICLLVGLTVGFFTGYRDYQPHMANEAVKQMIAGMESSDRLAAARGLRAIELIEAGNTNKAIEMFSSTIAYFYLQYDHPGADNELTLKLRAKIEQLAKTNQVVAAQIKEASTNIKF